MSIQDLSLPGLIRRELGKGASRRLRKEEMVLGIVYGGKEAPTPIKIEQRLVAKALENEAFFTQIINLDIEGTSQKVILRDLQRHPFKPKVLHVDFQRVDANDILTVNVPLHFLNEDKCKGVKLGGIIDKHMIEIEVRCKANNIPEHIDIDLLNAELNSSILLSEIILPEGIQIETLLTGESHDQSVLSVHLPKVFKAEEETDSTGSATGTETK